MRGVDVTSSGELAYRQGWLLARIGRTGPDTQEALRFAAAQDDKDPRIHFLRGWVDDVTQFFFFHPSIHWVIPFFEYSESVTISTSHGSLSARSPSMAAVSSMRLFVV